MLIGRNHKILLSDFGIAATAHSTSSMSTQVPVGTIPYMAPEQIHPSPCTSSQRSICTGHSCLRVAVWCTSL
jgi:serine/threonine protein kinase